MCRCQAGDRAAAKIDENGHVASLLQAYELGCLDAVALKISKFGGIHAMRPGARSVLSSRHDVCRGYMGVDITTAAVLHIGAATPAGICSMSAIFRDMSAPGSTRHRNVGIAAPKHRGWVSRLMKMSSADQSPF